jgi:predicted extracellular nuclease
MYRFIFLILTTVGSAYSAPCELDGISIEAIQGHGHRSPYVSKKVKTSGLVTAVLKQAESQYGYFIQEEDVDPSASHGLFVYSETPASVGDLLVIEGKVKEFHGLTELVNVNLVQRCGQQDRPIPVSITYELTNAQKEALEGVLVQLPRGYLSRTDELLAYGQLELSGTWPKGKTANHWGVDDGSSKTKPKEIGYLSEIRSIGQLTLGARNKPFAAVLGYSFDEYRLIPVDPITLEQPETDLFKHPSDLRLVTLNAYNFFNGNGKGEHFLKNRGANSVDGYRRQLSSLVHGLSLLNGDIIVLNEVENDGFSNYSSLHDLVVSLNQAAASSVQYQAVVFTREQLGSGAIQNVILFNNERIRAVGNARSITEFEGWKDRWHRPFVSQVFEDRDSNQQFAVAGAHLKSKAGKCPGDSSLILKKYGACSGQRVEAVSLLNQWTKSWDEQLPIFVMGDFNAHPSDPSITNILDENWTTPFDLNRVYSYVYKGTPNVLDYIFVKDVDDTKITNSRYWNINTGVLNLSKVIEIHPQLGQLSPLEVDVFSDHDPVFIDVRWRDDEP